MPRNCRLRRYGGGLGLGGTGTHDHDYYDSDEPQLASADGDGGVYDEPTFGAEEEDDGGLYLDVVADADADASDGFGFGFDAADWSDGSE